MEQGSLKEHHLENAVFQVLSESKIKDGFGPGIGRDYGECEGILSADGFGRTPKEAFQKARGNFLCALGKCKMMRIQMCLPIDTKQGQIKSYMQSFKELADAEDIAIIGGQSQVSECFQTQSFFVEMIGQKEAYQFEKKQMKEGADIVMVGNAGENGNLHLLEDKHDELRRLFSEAFLEKNVSELGKVNPGVLENALKKFYLETKDILYVHDISTGGVYAALWQLGKACGKGLWVENRWIPIRQETIEICEAFDCNPYLLDGTGAYLIVSEEGKKLQRYLMECGMDCAVIGAITSQKERTVRFGNEESRTLTSDTTEELYRVL